MPRIAKAPDEQDTLRNSARLEAMLSPRMKAKSSGPRPKGEKSMMALVERWKERAKNEDYEGAGPEDIVAMFVWAHEEVYDVSVFEEVRKTFVQCRAMAMRLLNAEFGGNFAEALEYLRWAWGREQGREQWRRAHPGEHGGGRLTLARLCGATGVLTDYRLNLVRKSGSLR